MPDAHVQITVRHHVATLTFDDPARRNAMTPELGDAFRDAVQRVKLDPDVRAVVVTGAGGAFSAGGDLRMLERLRTASRDESRAFMLEFYAKYLSVTELDVPTVAAVQGPAIGAGLCVALACDLCIVDEQAKLALNFVQLGLHPGMGATYLAPRRAGAMRGAELLFTGRRFDGREAVSLGMALRAVPSAETLSQATDLAEQIARNAPLAVRALRTEMGIDRRELQKALELEATFQAESYASKDLGEGLAAAAQKRAPKFVGE
jgi:enoyl-CoA hydratase/carnithine racemase